MEIATSESWKNEPLPIETTQLTYSRIFTPDEYSKLSRGLIPQEMEDKWFSYLDSDILYLHRSWTGHCIYKLTLTPTDQGYAVSEVFANRRPEHYKETDNAYDVEMMDFLISNLLLGENKPFPKPADMKEAAPGVYQHHVSGTGYPEKEVGETKPWWKFWGN